METKEPDDAPEFGEAIPTPAAVETMPQVEQAFEEIEVDTPLVGIVMGSKSDKPKMQPAGEALHEHGIRYEVRVMSAHRDPDTVRDYCSNARMRGLRVIIAGAGMSAALPGVVAAETLKPVIGVPVKSSALEGLDALLSIAQMPPGVPVATVAVGGGANAALLAAQMLSLKFALGQSSFPSLAITAGGERFATLRSGTGAASDITLLATNGGTELTATIGTPGALDHTAIVASGSDTSGALAYYRNLGGFRNQLVVVGFNVSSAGIELGAPVEIVHETPAPPYAPAITHVRDGVYFVAWAEGTSPDFSIRGELLELF